MTDKPTAPDLAALSAAATTQGEWEVDPQCYDDCGGRYLEISSKNPYDVVLGEHGPSPEDAAFIVALVNEYRAGRLVQIDEGMRERVARALYEKDDVWHKAWPWPDLHETQGSPDAYRDLADAAIAAMMGGAK